MILDIPEGIRCFDIDPELRSLSVVSEKTLASYDLRKFNKNAEFKVSSPITQLRQRDDGYITIVTEQKVSLCKIGTDSIQNLIEFHTKDKLDMNQRAEIVYDDGTNDLAKFRFLMITRNDLVELIEVNISQSGAKGEYRQFYRVDGKIIDYKLHPSNEYLIILTNTGYYYIFNII